MDSRDNQLARPASSHTQLSIFSRRQAEIAGVMALLAPSASAAALDSSNDPALYYGLLIGIPVGAALLIAAFVILLFWLKQDCCFSPAPTGGRVVPN